MELLTSVQNPRVKAWAALKERKFRNKSGTYLIEGIRSVDAHLQAGADIETILFDSWGAKADEVLRIVEACEKRGIRAFELTSQVLAHVADTETPQGVLAIVKIPARDPDAVLALHGEGVRGDCSDVVLVVDGVRDPGNLGTMIRTADAVGARAVVLLGGTVDPYNPKVVRATMGSLVNVPMLQIPGAPALEFFGKHGYRLVAADAHEGGSLFATDLTGPIAITIGSEVEGLSQEVNEAASRAVMLPMPGSAESLNAGIAASVILYEALRQRLA